MNGMQIILVVSIFLVLLAGASVIGFAITRAEKREKPKLLLIGLGVVIPGVVLGYMIVELFLVLEGQGH